ncbi:putative S-phase kinase-associated protein [Medicago truncatula]|uniref:Putative S-phase kinase-associated protein n=1 Tax=Medicago truncatula TaxID=3880 RepID=G7I3U0_MEDTR|nr:SKP1 family, dimerization domain protein [Medicago truncatula]RHN78562.1 putative S-phase kinase-associated protein [Medicago truncatula]
MKVKCCDGVVLELEDALVYASSTVQKLIEKNISSRGCISVCHFGGGQGNNFEISFEEEISRKTLLKIKEYVKKHEDARDNEKSLRIWDQEFIKVDHRTLFAIVLAAHYLKIRDLVDLSCETVTAKNDMTPREEEEYQSQTVGKNKGKSIISEEVLGQQCSMEERVGFHRVNLIKGGSSKWAKEGDLFSSKDAIKLQLENMSVKRLTDVEVAQLARDYKASIIQQCVATVLKPVKNKMRHKRRGVQTVTNRNKKRKVISTKFDRFVKVARGPYRRRNVRGRGKLQQQSF